MHTLLVVDDEPLLVRGIRTFVDFDALAITKLYVATDGAEALELFSAHRPDMVLADINMPKMNGLDFAAQAKELKPDVKIAMITGYDYFDYALAALKLGVDDYILKPVSKKDIQEILQKLTARVQEAKRAHEVSQLVVGLIPEDGGTAEASSYKKQIQQEINAHIGDKHFSLSYLANALSLSSSYLSSLFKTLYGTTFQNYMITARLDRAKILLLSTDMKVYEIAAAVGFEDPNYFSAAFKKQFGASPNRYKEQSKE